MMGVDDPCEDWDETEEDANPVPDENGQIRLASAVLKRATNSKPGFTPWYRRLPAEVQAELNAIRHQWRSGETGLQKRAIARAIIAEMRSRDLPVSGVQGVEHWLDQGDP